MGMHYLGWNAGEVIQGFGIALKLKVPQLASSTPSLPLCLSASLPLCLSASLSLSLSLYRSVRLSACLPA